MTLEALSCPQCGAALPQAGSYLICQYCGTSVVVTLPAANRGRASAPRVFRGMKLARFTLQDAGGTGLAVFRMLVPVGWEMEGGVAWDLSNVGMPGTLGYRAWNPLGPEAFEIHPNMNFTGGSFGGMLGSFFGATEHGAEVRDPVDARTALRDLVIPRYRGRSRGLRIERVEAFPELATHVAGGEASAAGMRQVDAAKARISYQQAEHPIEEEFFAAVEVWRTPGASLFMPENLFWYVSHILSFRGRKGKLDATAGLFDAMVKSIKLNGQWKSAYEQIINRLAQGQIAHTRMMSQISSQIAQEAAEISDENLNGWYARGEADDWVARETSKQIRDVETYWDPNLEMEVELPSEYEHVWANSLGEYIVTDSALYDPNVELDSSLSWEPLEPAR